MVFFSRVIQLGFRGVKPYSEKEIYIDFFLPKKVYHFINEYANNEYASCFGDYFECRLSKNVNFEGRRNKTDRIKNISFFQEFGYYYYNYSHVLGELTSESRRLVLQHIT